RSSHLGTSAQAAPPLTGDSARGGIAEGLVSPPLRCDPHQRAAGLQRHDRREWSHAIRGGGRCAGVAGPEVLACRRGRGWASRSNMLGGTGSIRTTRAATEARSETPALRALPWAPDSISRLARGFSGKAAIAPYGLLIESWNGGR